MKIFEYAKVKDNLITIDGKEHSVVKGKHAFWIPDLEMKIVWSHNGEIESYTDWDKGRNKHKIEADVFNEGEGWDRETLISVSEEYHIFKKLSEFKMSPAVKGIFWIKSFESVFPFGGSYCDPMGKVGFFIEDANKLEEGEFTLQKFMDDIVDRKLISLSAGALGDLGKPNNSVNGYLIDVRRTIWDMMKLTKGSENLFLFEDDVGELKERIKQLSQFPYKERKQNYQSYWLEDYYEKGSRDTLYRFDKMGIEEDLDGKTVLDLGCQLGSIAMECYRRGARKVTGIECEEDYIKCARDLCRVNKFHINFLERDLRKPDPIIKEMKEYYKKPIDIIFALALHKHIDEALWVLLEKLDWKVCYIESHNAPDGIRTPHVQRMMEDIEQLTVTDIEDLGMVEDRSPRVIWKLTR